MLSQGPVTAELERELAQYLNKNFALFTGNGSQAQALILMAKGVGPGSEVILPSYVCHKVYSAIEITGATPVLTDIGDNWVMTPAEVKKAITSKTKAIILPHVYGINAWTEEFNDFGIPVLEDICQSLGHNNAAFRTGTYTPFAFTSFHGTKPMGAGEGGMMFVNDETLFHKILEIRESNPLITDGNELVAAVALSQFKRYNSILNRRKEIAEFFMNSINPELWQNMKMVSEKSMYFRFLLKSTRPFESIKQEFYKRGIHVRKGVDNLIHREIGLSDNLFPNSTRAYETTVSIPLLPQLTHDQLLSVTDAVEEIHRLTLI
jgi:dTDP-4-amino-4,6-dideoxygalactose transaminase